MISDHNRNRSVPNDTRVAETSGQNAPRKTIPDESQTPTTSGGPESRMLQAPCQLYRGKETTQFDCLITSIVTTVSAALVGVDRIGETTSRRTGERKKPAGCQRPNLAGVARRPSTPRCLDRVTHRGRPGTSSRPRGSAHRKVSPSELDQEVPVRNGAGFQPRLVYTDESCSSAPREAREPDGLPLESRQG